MASDDDSFLNADPTTKKLSAGVGLLSGIGAYALGAGLVVSGVAGLAVMVGIWKWWK